MWDGDGGLAVVSLQLHLHCDGLLILLTHTLLQGPEGTNTQKICTGEMKRVCKGYTEPTKNGPTYRQADLTATLPPHPAVCNVVKTEKLTSRIILQKQPI